MPIPYVKLARAAFNREQVIKALWPGYVDDTVAVEALIESAGKRLSGRSRPGNRYVMSALVQAALEVRRSPTYLG